MKYEWELPQWIRGGGEAFQEEVKAHAKAWSYMGTPSRLRWYEASWVLSRNRQGNLRSHKAQPKEMV